MADALTLRRTHPDHESYATLFEHPQFGKIDVGRISQRRGNPVETEPWTWSIQVVCRPGGAISGNARTMKAAIAAWRMAWPMFRDRFSDADWHDAKAAQDFSEKKTMIAGLARLRPKSKCKISSPASIRRS